MRWAAPYDRATRCTGDAEPGARGLLAYLTETYDGHSGGIYNCRSVRGGSTTSTHGEGRSVDWMVLATPGKPTALGLRILRDLGEHAAELGIQCVIYARRIYDARSPEGRYYGGEAPHWDHLHIELTREAGNSMRLADFRRVLGAAAPTPTPDVQEDDMELLIACEKESTVFLVKPSVPAFKQITPTAMAVIEKTGTKRTIIDSEAAMRNAFRLP